MYYSAHVRVLDLGFSERLHDRNVVADPYVYDHLSHMNNDKPLLPHLREMSWSQKGASDRRIVYLIPPTLRRLHIRTHDGSDNPRMLMYRSRYLRDIERRRYKEPRRRDHVLRWILREVLPKAVNLEHLTLDGFHHLTTLVPVSGCPRLETLEVRSSLANSTVDVSQLIATFGSLTTLSRLTMSVDQMLTLEEDVLQPVKPLFESLYDLHLLTRIGQKPQPPALMFATAECRRLRKLSIEFDVEDAGKLAESSDLHQILRLPSSFAHICILHVRLEETRWRSAPLQLSDLLSPLATLRKLEKLYLICEETLLACTDEDIRLITRHWWGLTTFAANFLPESGGPSVRVLNYIAQGWPKLEVLCLPSLRNLAEFDKNVQPHHSLRRLGILSFVAHRSCIEVGNFAVYLSLRFPNLFTERPFPPRLGDSNYNWQPCHSWWKILAVVKQARSVIRRRYNWDGELHRSAASTEYAGRDA